MRTHSDVVICGGGLAGLTLGLHLRQELPSLSVTIIERTERPLPVAAHKIGESAVELGSMYFEDLGLLDNLRSKHLLKLGLRFFPGGGELPLHERAEFGPAHEPRVVSYQIDRGVFEEDLRAIAVERGIDLREGAAVTDVELGAGSSAHRVSYRAGSEEQGIGARWVIDASGRNALLKKKLKLGRGSGHLAHSGWFRMKGRVDITSMVPSSETAWHEVPLADQRFRSTNHLMGEGYWLWIIPLAGDVTSIGMVVHDEVHDFERVRTLENLMAFIREVEPHIAPHLEGAEVMDFLCLKRFSHGVSRSWSADRWGIVGVAGAFLDPLYSNGSDFIALANVHTVEAIRADVEGDDLEARVRDLNVRYHALVSGSTDIFKKAAPIYAHARAMLYKLYWDNFCYWCFPCQYYRQGLYRLSQEEYAAFNEPGGRFVELSVYVQTFLSEWARMAPEAPRPGFMGLPRFPSLPVDAHLALLESLSRDEALAYINDRVRVGEEMVAEMLRRVVRELGPERAQELLDRIGYSRWNLPVKRAVSATSVGGDAPRSPRGRVARDVDKSLGRILDHADAARAEELLDLAG